MLLFCFHFHSIAIDRIQIFPFQFALLFQQQQQPLTTTHSTVRTWCLKFIVSVFHSRFLAFSEYIYIFRMQPNRIITLSVFICLFICFHLLCSVCKFQYRFRNFCQIIMPFAAVQRWYLIDVYVQILDRIVFIFHSIHLVVLPLLLFLCLQMPPMPGTKRVNLKKKQLKRRGKNTKFQQQRKKKRSTSCNTTARIVNRIRK